jgi:UDPglucose 6-dehydrogenase
VLGEIYRPLSLNQAPVMYTARRTAELIKYAANAFLATKITFINEIADLSEKVGADVQEVARGIGSTTASAQSSCMPAGFRRLCFPKDTRALVKTAQDHDVPLRIVEAVLGVNDNRKRAMARKGLQRRGRQPARQDRGRARADLQAGHRRHARGAVDPAGHRPARHGRKVRAHDPVGMEAGAQGIA